MNKKSYLIFILPVLLARDALDFIFEFCSLHFVIEYIKL